MSRLTVHIENRAGDTVATPETWWPEGAAPFLDEFEDLGTLNINIQADETGYDDIDDDMIAVFSIDDEPVWRSIIRHRTVREVAEDEAGRYTTLVGVGEAGRLDELVVYPPGGLGRFPFADDRTFNWTAPEYDDSAWDPVVVTPNAAYGYPEGFPDGTAEWIWDEDSSVSGVPIGTKELRGHGTVATQRVHEAWSASDDTNETWLQGISILTSAATAYVGKSDAVELLVSAGDVTVAARVANLNILKAGYLFSLLVPLDDTVSPVIHSDDTWVFRPDGEPLGMNAGAIYTQLRSEAIARGEQVPAVDFDVDLDSNGNAWTVYEELTVQVGATYWDVLKQMVELEMCDFRMDPASYTLHLYNAGEAGTEVAYTLGDDNLTSLTFDVAAVESTALLVRWGRGYTDEDDTGLVTAHGRRVSLLNLGGVSASSTARAQAAKVIGRLGRPQIEVSAEIDPEDVAHEPYQLYRPGDSIDALLPDGTTAAQRVNAVAPGLDEAGNLIWTVHLSDAIAEREKREQVILKRLGAGAVGGRSTASTIPYQPRPIQPRPADPIVFNPVEDAVVVSASKPYTFTRAQRVREVQAELETASSSGSVVVEFKKNGTTFETVTLASGVTYESVPIATDVVFIQRVDVLTVEVTSAGTGAEKLTAKVIAA